MFNIRYTTVCYDDLIDVHNQSLILLFVFRIVIVYEPLRTAVASTTKLLYLQVYNSYKDISGF
jgi:hypothetical protein